MRVEVKPKKNGLWDIVLKPTRRGEEFRVIAQELPRDKAKEAVATYRKEVEGVPPAEGLL